MSGRQIIEPTTFAWREPLWKDYCVGAGTSRLGTTRLKTSRLKKNELNKPRKREISPAKRVRPAQRLEKPH